MAEIIGLYILNKLSSVFGIQNIGLYRDDGLAVMNNASGPEMERARKNLIKIFKDDDFSITADTNLEGTDFLDVYLNLKSGRYKPYHKPNDVPLYVHSESNHPPTIIKKMPEMIEQRVSKISCDKTEFEKAKKYYENALEKSGYKKKLSYVAPVNKTKKRKRKIIWFNPPYSKNVRTNVGKVFLSLIKKHFPPHHKLHKIFNRNNVKVSYSCMDSMEKIINNHNSAIIKSNSTSEDLNTKTCNCRKPELCPLSGECLTQCIVYKATVTTGRTEKYYYGSTEGTFKKRWTTHNTSFKNVSYEHSTALSTFIWSLKDEGKEYDIQWEISKKSTPYKCGGRSCNLCLEEKLYILRGDKNMINPKSELISKCRHKNKFSLEKFENG